MGYVMEMKLTTNTKKSILTLGGAILTIKNASASSLGLSDFVSGNALAGLGDAKPIMTEVMVIVVGLFVASCFVGIFASGTTSNTGLILHNAAIRSKGIAGIATVVGIIVLVIVAVVLFFHFYNSYLAGA
jgi:hypothetical protein